MNRCLALFAVGFLLGPIGDAGHVTTGTLEYHWYGLPLIMSSPLWFSLLIGTLTVSLGMIKTHLAPKLGERADRSIGIPRTVLALTVFMAMYGVTGILPRQSLGVQIVGIAMMGVVALLFWVSFNEHRSGLALGVIAAIAGVAGEITLLSTGVFSYSGDMFLVAGVPLWLPMLYFTAGVCIGTLDATLRAVGSAGRVAAPATKLLPGLGSQA